jgi:hypothetical protein
MDRGPVVYFAATIWALVGGFILIGDAVRLRRLRQLLPAEASGGAGPTGGDDGASEA